jgi:hypothetical protein
MGLDTFGVRQQVLCEMSWGVCYGPWVRISYSAVSLSLSLFVFLPRSVNKERNEMRPIYSWR